MRARALGARRQSIASFTGRGDELARLDRWSSDASVRLVAVTAWGGAGKTALVTHWVNQRNRPRVSGVFGWSFYINPSGEEWAKGLLSWADRTLGLHVSTPDSASAVLSVLRTVPVLLVLDGLELLQEGPASGRYGRLLSGVLRSVLAGTCTVEHQSLVVLTSRFPFSDLASFDGTTARVLDLPPLTVDEGARLLAPSGLALVQRRDLVTTVDGHALAVSVMAGALALQLAPELVSDLRARLAEEVKTAQRRRPGAKLLRRPAGRATALSRGSGVTLLPPR